MIRNRTDFKRNNKIGLRNFSESVDFHDSVKTLLVRQLRRKHKDSHAVPIYTEFNPDKSNDEYPDIWMRIKQDIIVYEIQKAVSKKWVKQIVEKYEEVDLIMVNLKDVEKAWIKELRKSPTNPIEKLNKILEVYVV